MCDTLTGWQSNDAVIMTTEVDNVTSSSSNVTSPEDRKQFVETLVEDAIIRYVFPVVIIIGKCDVVLDVLSACCGSS